MKVPIASLAFLLAETTVKEPRIGCEAEDTVYSLGSVGSMRRMGRKPMPVLRLVAWDGSRFAQRREIG